jgi:hypothetical protein
MFVVDTDLTVTRLLYNAVLDENIYLLFALFDLQSNNQLKSDAKNLRQSLLQFSVIILRKKKYLKKSEQAKVKIRAIESLLKESLFVFFFWVFCKCHCI